MGFAFHDFGLARKPYWMGCHRVRATGCKLPLRFLRDGPRRMCCNGKPTFRAIPMGHSNTSGALPALMQLVRTVHYGTDAELEEMLDMDGLLRLMAVDLNVGHWYNFWRNFNNFFIYMDTAEKPHFRIIPFDADSAFQYRFWWT